MSTLVSRVERDFLLKSILNEKIPLTCYKNRRNFILTLDDLRGEVAVFQQHAPVENIKKGTSLRLMLSFHGQIITFTIRADFFKGDFVICRKPKTLYKNLTRSFLRIPPPENLSAVFHFKGERYDLPFPIASGFEDDDLSEVFQGKSNSDLPEIIAGIAAQIKQFANGYKLVTFKERQPRTLEEMVMTQTGKALYLPSTQGFLPKVDPYPKKRIITEEVFKRYLESTGVPAASQNNTIFTLIKTKYEQNVFSEAYVPILFQEYVVGYIHIWNDSKDDTSLEFPVLDKIFDLAKIMCYSLKLNGHFEGVKMVEKTFSAKIIDISASGILFSYRNYEFDVILQKRDKVDIKLVTPLGELDTLAVVERRYREKTTNFIGCRFLDLSSEDVTFISDTLYGKVFPEGEESFAFIPENF
ncbi:MAG: PilZ domain-containing protein [Spirochaetes bacterium]|nr:PilZ domain-containing protein [Spirochaetota bacterium]